MPVPSPSYTPAHSDEQPFQFHLTPLLVCTEMKTLMEDARLKVHARALRPFIWPIILAPAFLIGCAVDRIRDDAAQMVEHGDYEHAVQSLEAGVKAYPDSAQLRARLLLARSQALSQLIAQATAAEDAGNLDLAEKLLTRAQAFDTGGQRASALLADLAVVRRQNAALQRANELVANGHSDVALKVVSEALKDNRRHAGLLALQRRLRVDQRQAQVRTAQQGLAETRPITLDFRDASIRSVLDVVGRSSGLNFVIDKDVRDQRVTVFAKAVRFEDALDMILTTSQLARKVLDSKTVLIYPNSPEKQREYQEQLVKVFYLANGDAKGAAAFLKAMMKLRDPFIDEHSNMIALRDSLENIQLAERLMTLFDNPEPEVVLDVEVLEVDADRLTELGVGLPSQITLTPLSTTASSSLTLASFPLHRNNIGVGIPSITLNANHTVGNVDTLANPRIRTRSHEKAKVLIGDKIPIITTTTTAGTVGSVAESVSYQDVGVKLEVEPTVYPDDDVAIRLNVEVSTLGTETKTANGTIAYQISTRNASTLLQLHDGETQLLAGLISNAERSSTAGLPGLSDVPLLGRMFSDQTNSRSRTELVLSLTPHLVRSQPHLDAADAEAWVGTEAYQRLKPSGGRFDTAASSSSNAPATPVAPAQAVRASSLPAGSTTSTLPSELPVVAGSPPTIAWQVPKSVQAGQVFSVQLWVRAGVAPGAIDLSLSYPSDLLGLVGFSDSDIDPAASWRSAPTAHEEPGNQGVIEIPSLVPNPSTKLLSLGTVQFKALKAGSAEITLKTKTSDPSVNVSAPEPWKLSIAP